MVQVGSYQTVSGSEGNYVLAVPVGTYQVDVSKEGYQPETVTGVVVSDGAVTTLDIDLTVLSTVLVHGLVFDGSGHGWPLYAKITVSSSQSDQVIYTDPFTGLYQVSLYQGQPYTFMVEAVLPGYQPLSFTRTYSTKDHQEDINLSINQQICSAPVYGWAGGLAESFDYPTIPDGWQVTDNAGTGAVWTFSPTRDNLTGGSGNFVIADSDRAGFVNMDTSPVYPPYGFVSILSEWPSGLKQAWTVLPFENQVWVTSPGEGWMGSNALFSYDNNQTLPSSRLNFSWQPLYGPADLAWDQNHQTAWMMNIHDSNQYCIYAINLQTGQTGEMICPNNNGFANAQRGLAYDPVSDTFWRRYPLCGG